MSYFRSDNGIKSIFGEKAFRKLVGILDPCCGGIDEVDGNPDNFLNQQGEWVEGGISCEGVNTCLGISEEGDETLVLNQKGNWIEVQIPTPAYKVYSVLLSQTGTSAPVATILENTLGVTPVWNYQSQGLYYVQANGVFINNKTTVTVSPLPNGLLGAYSAISFNGNDWVYIDVKQANGQSTNNSLSKTFFEIRVYN
jgi:hypothetical protein